MKARRYWWVGLAIGSAAAIAACANGTAGTTGTGNEDSGGGSGDDASAGSDSGNPYQSDSGSSDAGDTDSGFDAGPSCIDDDAGCSTGSPGLCNGGNHHCAADGGSICVPLYTEQPCYSGGATTRNKGICHDGTQTCTGALGACEGEALPNGVSDGGVGTPVEDCFNNLDDDCDGLVNNGCPVSLHLGPNRALTARGGSGGGFHAVLCPTNEFAYAANIYFDHDDAHASGVEIFCAAMTLNQGVSSYTVSLSSDSAADPNALGSGTTNLDDSINCGIGSLTGLTWLVGQTDTWVEGFKPYCGNGTMTFNADNTLTFSFTRTGAGNFLTYPGGTQFQDNCASNEVLVGFNVRDGAWMDQIQAVCAPIQVTYSAGTPDP